MAGCMTRMLGLNPAAGGPIPFTGFRSSNMTATSGTSATITLPTGAQAGDELWLFRECTNANNATAGFTAHVALTGTFCNGRVEYKTLDAADIAAGSISITMASGAGAGVVWAVCLQGVPTTKVTTNSTDFHRDGGGGGTTRSITTVESAAVGDFAMLFAAQRDSSATSPTPSIGTVDQDKTGAPAASGRLITSIGSAGTLSCTWTYHTSISNGSFNGIVIVRA
jgi:hypothetical protein